MSKSERQKPIPVATETGKVPFEETDGRESQALPAFEMLPDDEPLLTKTKRWKKEGDGKGWNEKKNCLTPDEALDWIYDGGNYGFALGNHVDGFGALGVLDIEEPNKVPDGVFDWVDEHALLVFRSVHIGKNAPIRLTRDAYELLDKPTTQRDLDDDGIHELELLTSLHAVGPGSVINHKHCRGAKPCNGAEDGTDQYHLEWINPDIPLVTPAAVRELFDILDIDVDEQSDSDTVTENTVNEKYDPEDVPEVNDDLVAIAQKNVEEFQTNTHTTTRAFNDLLGILQGGTGTFEGPPFYRNGGIDRSATEYVGLSLLYGVMRDAGEPPERAEDLTYVHFTHFCEEIPYTKDGQPRKWLRDEDYRQDHLSFAIRDYDENKWRHWRRRSPRDERNTGEYSGVTYDKIQVALNVLCNVMTLEDAANHYGIAVPDSFDGFTNTPDKLGTSKKSSTPTFSPENYPNKQDVVDLAQRLDPTRTEKTHENSLSRLQREDGVVKMVYCGGNDYRYYPAHLPDPSDAEYVKVNGEERPPQL